MKKEKNKENKIIFVQLTRIANVLFRQKYKVPHVDPNTEFCSFF